MKDIHTEANERSLASLVAELTHDISLLVRKETELAKSEMSGKFSQALTRLAFIIMAAVVALGEFFILLEAAVYALSTVLQPWLSALIVGLVVGAIGFALLQKGRHDLTANNLMPEKTVASVKRNQQFAKEHMR